MRPATPAPNFHIQRLAPLEQPRRDQWIHALRALDLSTAKALKIEGGNSVCAATMLGREVVVKVWRHSSLAARFKLLTRSTRAHRHWRGAAWLSSHGFATASPLLLATARGNQDLIEYLVMEQLQGPSLLEEMDAPSLPRALHHRLAGAVGRQAAQLVLAGRFNRDHKPSNLIVTNDGPALIDTVAIRRCPRAHRASLVRMLASLVIEPMGMGCLPRRALLMRGLTEAAATVVGRGPTAAERKDLWRNIARRVFAHGDPTPRVDPRARRGFS